MDSIAKELMESESIQDAAALYWGMDQYEIAEALSDFETDDPYGYYKFCEKLDLPCDPMIAAGKLLQVGRQTDPVPEDDLQDILSVIATAENRTEGWTILNRLRKTNIRAYRFLISKMNANESVLGSMIAGIQQMGSQPDFSGYDLESI